MVTELVGFADAQETVAVLEGALGANKFVNVVKGGCEDMLLCRALLHIAQGPEQLEGDANAVAPNSLLLTVCVLRGTCGCWKEVLHVYVMPLHAKASEVAARHLPVILQQLHHLGETEKLELAALILVAWAIVREVSDSGNHDLSHATQKGPKRKKNKKVGVSAWCARGGRVLKGRQQLRGEESAGCYLQLSGVGKFKCAFNCLTLRLENGALLFIVLLLPLAACVWDRFLWSPCRRHLFLGRAYAWRGRGVLAKHHCPPVLGSEGR